MIDIINPGQKNHKNLQNMANFFKKEVKTLFSSSPIHHHHHHSHSHHHEHDDEDQDSNIFSFDDEDHFTPALQPIQSKLKKSKTVPINLSSYPFYSSGPQADLQNEEIINIQPKNHFSFDVLDDTHSVTPTSNIYNNNNSYKNNVTTNNNNNNNIWNAEFWNQKLDKHEYSEDSSDLVSSMIGNLSIKGNGGGAATTTTTGSFYERPNSPEDSNNYFYSSYEEITIEDIRVQLHSCLTCGVYWREGQVSLDCRECGGYPLSRPCPTCNGECETQWNRNLAETHSLGRARWVGVCSKDSSSSSSLTSSP